MGRPRGVRAAGRGGRGAGALALGGLIALSLGLAWLGIWRGRVRLLGLAGIAAGVISAGVARPPDLLISADARLIGLRLPVGVFVEAKSGASPFTRDAWQSAWVAPVLTPLPQAGGAADGAITCDEHGCLARLVGGQIRLARSPPLPDECAAALIVAGEPIRLRCPEGQAAIIDRFSVWREGAIAVWLDPPGHARIVTTHDVTGDRPWAPPPRRAGASPGLPLATEE